MIEYNSHHTSEPDKLTLILLNIIGVYTIFFVFLLNIFIFDKGNSDERAAIFLPFLFAILALPIIWIRNSLGIQFLPGV